MEEEFWKAKSGMHWLKAGDKNTRFFHEKRRAANRITALEDEGRICTDQKHIQQLDMLYKFLLADSVFLYSP